MPTVISGGGNPAPPFVPQFDVVITVARFVTPTGPGNVDWTTPDLKGKTPKAVEFVICKAVTDGAARDNLIGAIGYADGTSEFVSQVKSRHGLGVSITSRSFDNTKCITIAGDSTGTAANASFVSFIADGVRLNFTTVSASENSYFVIAKFFAGTDLSVTAFSATMSTQDTEVDVTGIGFEPDLVIMSAAGPGDGRISYGAAHSAGDSPPTITQKALLWRSPNSQPNGNPISYLASNRCGGALADPGGGLDFGVEAANFDADGFSLFARDDDSNSDVLAGLALKFGGAESWVGSLDSPTALGDWTKTAPSFKPQIVTIGMTAAQAEDADENDADAGPFGIAAFDLEGNEFSAAWAEESGPSIMNNQSLSDDRAVNFTDDTGSQAFAASFSSMDANGWTLDFTDADPTTRKWFGWAVQLK